MHRCTERGMDRRNTSKVPFEHISIDEKSFKNGHKYVTVLSHPRSGVVLDVGEDRDSESVEGLLTRAFTDQQRESMKTVSMDMWKAYINSVENKLPNAEIVHDKFHLIAHLNKGMDQVRWREVDDNQEVKLVGRGYRTFKNFRSAILFFHGGLDLYPLKW